MKSILQLEKQCYICGTLQNLNCHHVFPGSRRQTSEKWGCKVWLCMNHHTGNEGVHRDTAKLLKLKQNCQRKFEELYGHEKFMSVMGRNYLEE